MLTEKSKTRLATCHPDLIRLIEAVDVVMHVNVSEGHRDKATQDRMFAEGKSKLKWPNGKHCSIPSMAVDIYPIGSDGQIDWKAFDKLGKTVKEKAKDIGIKITWGGDWRTLVDKPHFEL